MTFFLPAVVFALTWLVGSRGDGRACASRMWLFAHVHIGEELVRMDGRVGGAPPE